MSVAGLKKKFYKASQMVSEKVGGAEGTKLDEDFKDLDRKADVTSKAVVEIISKTTEYLQPNPASRAKLTMLNTVSKMRGQEAASSPGYTQPEGLLGECMIKYGQDMTDSNFGLALVEIGESMRRLSEVKDSLDIDVKQNFIDPLQAIADKDIKDIQHHMKKLENRRLDYDYKKKRQGKIPDEEIRQALEKFHESKELAEVSMHNLLETDVEQVCQLSSLVDCMLQYHQQASQVLQSLSENLKVRMSEAQSRPKREYVPKARPTYDHAAVENSNGGYSTSAATPPAYYPGPSFQSSSIRSSSSEPHCKALYDFEPENDGELAFVEGDVIALVSHVDENWLEGSLRGRVGYFPKSYVNVVVPLPH